MQHRSKGLRFICLIVTICLTFVTWLLAACHHESDDRIDKKSEIIKGANIAASGNFISVSKCIRNQDNKANQIKEYIEYSCNDSRLSLHHVNVMYNCCPDNISAEIKIDSNMIIIHEAVINGMCNCICPYELVYEIGEIEPIKYGIFINNSLAGEIDISSSNFGKFFLAH